MLPKSRVKGVPGGIELELTGYFEHPHWIGFLLASLSSQNVSVISAQGNFDFSRGWSMTFLLDMSRTSVLPESINYVGLASKEVPPPPGDLVLSSYRIERTADNSLQVVLEGPDQIGFMAKVLARTSGVGLFPVQLDIRTVGGRIHDEFLFRGIAGLTPSETAEERLRELVQRWKSGQ